MLKITPGRADELLGRNWFTGYTDEVELYEEPVTVDGFDAGTRAEERDDTEFAVFGGGLTVRGTLDLGREVHSVYVVRGTLRAARVILGDAVLAVTDAVDVGEWLFGPRTEGVFDVAGDQVEPDPRALLGRVRAPLIAMFDRDRGTFVLREQGEPRKISDLAADVFDGDAVDQERLRERLCSGRPVFR
ncbi:hypothetical protein [Planomonospora sp. ID82291]|uniref:hypothetical protein n=1 Tax=Planomonospora sp. ID82291 TaxID=2738136 RepID=UPI0018C373E5|nr:hypothetical protein [Planomonospora sp. ID82291]MBG0818528.1 hypothetical protein [Planomonospora sp. ID82291]